MSENIKNFNHSIESKIGEILKFKKIAIIGSGVHTKNLLETFSELKKKTIAIFSNTENESSIYGIPIINESFLKDYDFDVALVSSRLYEWNICFRLLKNKINPDKIFLLYAEKEMVNKISGISHTKKRIAILCEYNCYDFMHDIVAFLKDYYDVKCLTIPKDLKDNAIFDWADIVWLEWAGVRTIEVTELPKKCFYICRLHSIEAYQDKIFKIIWEKIDSLVLVSHQVRRVLNKFIPDIEKRVKVSMIPNGVKMDKYLFSQRKKGFNLAFAANLNHTKNIPYLIQCFDYLHKKDLRYKLHICGNWQLNNVETKELKIYFDHMISSLKLEEAVILYDWVDDMDIWLQDKNYIVCTSLRESFGYGIAESMAKGIKPIIHNFPGSNEIFPEKFIFNTPYEFADIILNDDYNSKEYRGFIKSNYSFEQQSREIKKLIDSFYLK